MEDNKYSIEYYINKPNRYCFQCNTFYIPNELFADVYIPLCLECLNKNIEENKTNDIKLEPIG